MSGGIGIAIVGAGTMAGAHSAALTLIPSLYSGLPLRPRLVAAADVNEGFARRLAERFGWERTERDWQRVVEASDVDLVIVCLPPILNRDVVTAAAAADKHVVCEKPLAVDADTASQMLRACRSAGVFHGLGAAYRWTPALRAIRALIDRGDLGEIRSIQASFMLDYAADEDVPLLWRFQRAMAGGGIGIDTGYHLVDCARLLVGEVESVQGLTRTFIAERPLPGADAFGNRGDVAAAAGDRPTGSVDVEDAAAALLSFSNGAYGVIETSRVAIGKRVSFRLDVHGTRGSVAWDLEQPDEYRVALPSDPLTFGYRRVLVSPAHPGAAELLIAGTDGTSIGWLGMVCAMWAEFLSAIAEGRPAHANFDDGVRINAVIDAIYASAATGERTSVTLPGGVAQARVGA